MRQDIPPTLAGTYAAVVFEGLAPEFLEVEGALFLFNEATFWGRFRGARTSAATGALMLQPGAEPNIAAQNVLEYRIGSGLSNAELRERLRCEIRREFGPFVGVSWDRKLGGTARFARSRGDDVGGASLVVGIRSWF